MRDPEWGPAFVKTIAYAPYPIWIYLNGHEWAKRQAEQQGIAFEALDNGFRSVADDAALAEICNRLSERDIQAFWSRWEARLPSPFTAEDRLRGYRYALSMRQVEISDTRVFDQPAACRHWFEQVLTDELTLGRPDQVQITFARKITSRTRDGSAHASCSAAPSRRSRRTTSTPRSSSTSRKAARSGPRRPSTTPTTSGSAGS